MATIKSNLPGFIKPPTENHLAMYIDGPTRGATAILKGTGITIVEFHKGEANIFPWILTEVTHRLMKFRCSCGKSECTREAVFKATFKGNHPQSEGEPKLGTFEVDA
jgi:hypothetical protein